MFEILARHLLSSSRQVSRNFSSTMSIAEQFAKNGVVPDVSPVAPANVAKVSFNSGVEANFGNVLTPRQVKDKPTVTWPAKSGALYTLVKTDPDAPSRADPKFGEWEHWVVVNVPENNISAGETLAEYIGAGPPQGTGLHRYVYLVYEQPGAQKISDPEHGVLGFSGDKRNNWNVVKFAQKHKLGKPVAGNFFQAEFDDYVPELYKQLGA